MPCRRQGMLYFADFPRVQPVKYSSMVSTPIVRPFADFIDRMELGHRVSKGDRGYPERPAALKLSQYRLRRPAPQDARWSPAGKLGRQSREGVVGSKTVLGPRASRKPLSGTARLVASSSSPPGWRRSHPGRPGRSRLRGSCFTIVWRLVQGRPGPCPLSMRDMASSKVPTETRPALSADSTMRQSVNPADRSRSNAEGAPGRPMDRRELAVVRPNQGHEFRSIFAHDPVPITCGHVRRRCSRCR